MTKYFEREDWPGRYNWHAPMTDDEIMDAVLQRPLPELPADYKLLCVCLKYGIDTPCRNEAEPTDPYGLCKDCQPQCQVLLGRFGYIAESVKRDIDEYCQSAPTCPGRGPICIVVELPGELPTHRNADHSFRFG